MNDKPIQTEAFENFNLGTAPQDPPTKPKRVRKVRAQKVTAVKKKRAIKRVTPKTITMTVDQFFAFQEVHVATVKALYNLLQPLPPDSRTKVLEKVQSLLT